MHKIVVVKNYPEASAALKGEADIVIKPDQELMEKKGLRIEMGGRTLYSCQVFIKDDEVKAMISRSLRWPEWKPYDGFTCFMPRLKLDEVRTSLENILFAGC